ncbi:MAG: methylmalonyl-CoA mutase [Rhodospirillaceae bacterium]|jgi:methylmalonyl-CoA mutase C-terminal domain/subunit|nr:methylmalonyl-CoA mutase [Rhodospirillaceae bacterium]MBT3883605.1 methylmalonyl-CoA mutase [Rhodospirillaceae bacterium]MBT4117113.1 methylmalonyl-CoA mutase [Rhodospirillaceae bacterium]MBT4672858.1 methylmalonyl-CoA mutase [Rhodospirillaceae bacterium]MBT4720055.1 methylmalonyl-CoA mutase [Rhodospirillaceae bacterium]
MTSAKKIKVLIGKPGLDGHDVGAKIVARALIDAGFDVVYTGLRKTPSEIAQQAMEIEADVIGLSSLAGSHIDFCTKLKGLIDQYGLKEKLWLIGGCIPKQDHGALKEIGLDGIFPNGSRLDDIVEFISANTQSGDA